MAELTRSLSSILAAAIAGAGVCVAFVELLLVPLAPAAAAGGALALGLFAALELLKPPAARQLTFVPAPLEFIADRHEALTDAALELREALAQLRLAVR